MNIIETKQAQRFLYLKLLYDRNSIDLFPSPSLVVGRELGWDDSITSEVEEYMEQEKLIKPSGLGQICITHFGIKEVERKLLSPTNPTSHFSSPINILVVNGNISVNGDFVGRDKITNTDS